MELTRLAKKYPNGTLSRWELIAEHMNRSVQEVTFMAARLKEPAHRPTDSVAETIVREATKKAKKSATIETEDNKSTLTEVTWTQEQQKLFETAIVKYLKTSAGDRWQKIANTVPGKTKEECLARYKYLAQKVKRQKLEELEATQPENDAQAQHFEEIAEPTDNVESESKVVVAPIDFEPEPKAEPAILEKAGGKPRNKRKERKKRMEFSSDEEN